jgi:hypothetical protein
VKKLRLPSGISRFQLVFLRRHDDGLVAEILDELTEALAEKRLGYAS